MSGEPRWPEMFSTDPPGVVGVQVPMFEEVIREVMGYPVVTRVRPWTPLDVHQHWGRFVAAPTSPEGGTT